MKPSRIAACSNWVLERFPLTKLWNEHMAHYYAPKNFNIWYFSIRNFQVRKWCHPARFTKNNNFFYFSFPSSFW